MIARIWHGWTSNRNADAYGELLKTKILPGIHRVEGYKGAYLLRRPCAAETEFITITLWESMEAVREFAGPEGSHAVVPPEAQKLLKHYDQASIHYEAEWCP